MSETVTNTDPRPARSTAAGLLFLLAGCTASSPEVDTKPTPSVFPTYACTAEQTNTWKPVDNSLNLNLITTALGVSRDRVLAGMMILASCKQGIPVEQIGNGATVTVTGIPTNMHLADHCLAFMGDAMPSPGAIAHKVGGVCPALLN